jgi:hypothetical protein
VLSTRVISTTSTTGLPMRCATWSAVASSSIAVSGFSIYRRTSRMRARGTALTCLDCWSDVMSADVSEWSKIESPVWFRTSATTIQSVSLNPIPEGHPSTTAPVAPRATTIATAAMARRAFVPSRETPRRPRRSEAVISSAAERRAAAIDAADK